MNNLSQISKLLACNHALYILPYIEASCKCMVMACHGFSSYSKMGSLRFTSIFAAVKICNFNIGLISLEVVCVECRIGIRRP